MSASKNSEPGHLLLSLHRKKEITLRKLRKFTLACRKNISSNHLSLVVKLLLSRNFCQKRIRVNFCNFPTIECVNERRTRNETMESELRIYNQIFNNLFSGCISS